ncbi:MAG TPA: hypothetical protein VGR00_07840 [Thermoanaerobaculia bacterium]|nr:hypothetical protein [Thermoanaerobaculia bacterium]
MKRSSLFAVVLAATTFFLSPRVSAAPPVAAPSPCPKTGGVAIGQDRAEAFKMMGKDTVTNEVEVKHQPPGRPYKAEVTFDSTGKDARISLIHYVFAPPAGVLDALQSRYGKPSGAEAGWTYWLLPSCDVRVRYMLVAGPDGTIKGEEMFVEPLPKSAK